MHVTEPAQLRDIREAGDRRVDNDELIGKRYGTPERGRRRPLVRTRPVSDEPVPVAMGQDKTGLDEVSDAPEGAVVKPAKPQGDPDGRDDEGTGPPPWDSEASLRDMRF